MLEEILQVVEEQMRAKLAEARVRFRHSGNKGSTVEDAFRVFLREYLPRRFEVGHGEIIDSNNNRSGQTDIVIVNEDHPFTFTPNAPGLFFVEGVCGVGEVKSVLTSGQLTSTIAASRNFKKLRIHPGKRTTIHTNVSDRERFYTCPPYFLVAMESQLTIPAIISKINDGGESLLAKPYELIDAVFVLDKGWAINFGDGQGSFQFVTPEGGVLSGWAWQPSSSVLFDLLAWCATRSLETYP